MGLIARGLELAGIATTLTSWNAGLTRATAPPRAVFTKLRNGVTLGHPHDLAQQRRIIAASLALLNRRAPLAPVWLDEK